MEDQAFGTIHLHLDQIMTEKTISLNKLAFRPEMQRTQLKRYYNNKVQRLNSAVLCRLCYSLWCFPQDIIE